MRIDNFVYTEEALGEAARHLAPDGIIFVKFQVQRPWLGARLSEMLRQTFGVPPVIFQAESNYSTSATCFVISRSDRVNQALRSDPSLAEFVQRNALRLDREAVPITTDDWPYLYQRDRQIPRTYYSVSILVMLISIVLHAWLRRANRNRGPFSLFFFSMGAGFLLLETQIISRLALYFGTIWQVNGIVISGLLAVLLLANVVVEKTGSLSKLRMWAALVASLAAAYWFPFGHFEQSPMRAGMIAILMFSLPVLFAGILFSSEFRNAVSPSRALSANVLGAVAGGLLESLSLVYGLRALLIVAIVLYCLAGLGLLLRTKFAARGHASAIGSL